MRVDAITGDRTVVSSASVGSGVPFSAPSDLVLDAGSIVVVDNDIDTVFRVDPTTGDRTVISSPSVGSGMIFEIMSGVAVEASGDILVTDAGFTHDPLVGRIDPATGDRDIVSSPSVGGGSPPQTPFAVVVDADDDLIVLDNLAPFVLRVDPATGDRTIVSSTSVGSGPDLSAPRDFILVPEAVPFAPSWALAAILVLLPALGAVSLRLKPRARARRSPRAGRGNRRSRSGPCP